MQYAYNPLTGEILSMTRTARVLSINTNKLGLGMARQDVIARAIDPVNPPRVSLLHKNKPALLESMYIYPYPSEIKLKAGIGLEMSEQYLYRDLPSNIKDDPQVINPHTGEIVKSKSDSVLLYCKGRQYNRASVIVASYLGLRTSVPIFAYKIPNTPVGDYSLKYLFYIWSEGTFKQHRTDLYDRSHLTKTFETVHNSRFQFDCDVQKNMRIVNALSKEQRAWAKAKVIVSPDLTHAIY